MTPFYLGIFGISLLCSLLLTRTVRSFCVARGWVTPALSLRHVHAAPLPRMGGVAIYVSFVLSVGIAFAANTRRHGIVPDASIKALLAILLPATVILVLGIYDDVRSASPYTKFTVQALAAGILYAGGLRIDAVPIFFGLRHLGLTVGLPLTILWVIAITNAFNLLDGLDGLAAGSALFSTIVVFAVAVFSARSFVALMSIALAGAILGFLRYNFNPATIFLGDCGSLFIGFMLSAFALLGAQKSPTVIAVAIPVVSFGLPILDTSISMLRRWISGKPLFIADREHIHHKLLDRGLSHRQVVIVLYGVSALFALGSLFLLWPSGPALGLILAVLGTGIWFGVQQLGYLEFDELKRVAQRTMEQRSIFVNNLAIRRATEDLKRAHDYAQICRILESAFGENDFDAFDLEAELLPEEVDAGSHSMILLADRIMRFSWTKPSSANLLDDSRSTWSLTLDLVTSDNRRRGAMKIGRIYNQHPLLLDINFLTTIFPVVLADALDRSLSSPETLQAGTRGKIRLAVG